MIQSPPTTSVTDDDIDAFIAELTPAQRDILWKHPAQERRAIVAMSLAMRPAAQHSHAMNHMAVEQLSIAQFAERHFYIPATKLPVRLYPHQIAILNYMLAPENKFQTMIYSCPKKSGKSMIGSLVARWVAEMWGPAEVYCVGSDLEQSRGRNYQQLIESIELTPGFLTQKRLLPDRWHIIERQARFLPTKSTVMALSGDYRGSAGSAPTCSVWTELWANESEASRRMWEEMTPVPTRARSIRFVETYAGYSSAGGPLLDMYNTAMKLGVRLTHADIPAWPYDDQPPIWVHPPSQLVMYWDSGEVARRMPWQRGESGRQYYATQEQTLRPDAYRRLHLNEWVSSSSEFLPIEWWKACYGLVPPLDTHTPVVIGVDIAVTSDCTAVVGVSRHPHDHENVMIRFHRVWKPPRGGAIDLSDVQAYIAEMCAAHNIVQVCYDPYQAAKLAQDLTRDNIVWAKPFNQGASREVADFTLYTMIRDRRLTHDCHATSVMQEHLENAAAKTALQADSRLRIIKKNNDSRVDAVVAMSMAVSEVLRLNL